MKKLFFGIALLSASFTVQAETDFHGNCEFINFDTPGASYDSATFYFNEFQLEDAAFDLKGIAEASALVEQLGTFKGCGIDGISLEVDKTKSGCQELVAGVSESQSCFVKTNVGDFFMIKDALGGAQIVYNRLD